jgi:Mannosyl-glycoprotein endo-beta-N-acetylglucosaminidase/LysM domain
MRFFVFLIVLFSTAIASAQPTVDIIEYINTYKKLAMEEMQRTGVPAAITLAQGIHETYAGKSDLVLKSNNHFGIKCKAYWTGEKVYHDDDSRGECFRKYEDPAQSYRDHSDFLKAGERYAFLFQLDPTDYKGWATGIRKAGYATNPKYASIITKLIEDFKLEQYTLIAMGRMPASEEVIVQAPMAAPDTLLGTPRMADGLAPPPPQPPAEQLPIAEKRATPLYPAGEFVLNKTRVIFARSGTSLLTIAQEYDVPLSRLLQYNELTDQETITQDQLVYLQRKRKTGSNEFHVVAEGEDLYQICQTEAIRMESLLHLNRLNADVQPAVGEKLYLQSRAPARPKQ